MKNRNIIGLAITVGLGIVGCGVIGGGGGDGGGNKQDGGADMPAAVEAKFSSLYANYLSECKSCHTPTAIGRTKETESALDFTSVTTAYNTIKTGKATSLVGNQTACNSVAFLGATPAASLILAVLDQPTRAAFKSGTCDKDAVTDMVLKVGSEPSAAFITAFKAWIQAGAPNN